MTENTDKRPKSLKLDPPILDALQELEPYVSEDVELGYLIAGDLKRLAGHCLRIGIRAERARLQARIEAEGPETAPDSDSSGLIH